MVDQTGFNALLVAAIASGAWRSKRSLRRPRNLDLGGSGKDCLSMALAQHRSGCADRVCSVSASTDRSVSIDRRDRSRPAKPEQRLDDRTVIVRHAVAIRFLVGSSAILDETWPSSHLTGADMHLESEPSGAGRALSRQRCGLRAVAIHSFASQVTAAITNIRKADGLLDSSASGNAAFQPLAPSAGTGDRRGRTSQTHRTFARQLSYQRRRSRNNCRSGPVVAKPLSSGTPASPDSSSRIRPALICRGQLRIRYGAFER